MATKTISLELDAYERLKRSKRSARDSFSAVVRRAVWPDEHATAGDVLADMRMRRGRPEALPDERVLDRLDQAQSRPRRSVSKWAK